MLATPPDGKNTGMNRKQAVHQELSATDSSLKDLLIEDSSGSLFDSISWLLMNSGSLDFTDNENNLLSLKCSIDSIDSQCGFSVSGLAELKPDPSIFQSSSQEMPLLGSSSLTVPVVISAAASSEASAPSAPNLSGLAGLAGLAGIAGLVGAASSSSGGGASVSTLASAVASMVHASGAASGAPAVPTASATSGSAAAEDDDDDDDDDDDGLDNDAEEDSKGTAKKRKRDGSSGTKTNGPKKKRQREKVEDLEERVAMLKTESSELRSHLKDMTQRTLEMEQQRADMERLMAEKVSQIGEAEDTDQKDIALLLRRYRDVFSDYGSSRKKEVEFHLNQLKKLLIPTQTTKMCLWTLQQDKSFYQSNKSPLYDILSKELGMTSEQAARIQTHRQRILSLLEKLQESLQLTDDLQLAIDKKHGIFESRCGRFQSVISPRQTVLFLLWIDKHSKQLSQLIPDFNKRTEMMSSMMLAAAVAGSVGGFRASSICSSSSSSSGGGGGGGSSGGSSGASIGLGGSSLGSLSSVAAMSYPYSSLSELGTSMAGIGTTTGMPMPIGMPAALGGGMGGGMVVGTGGGMGTGMAPSIGAGIGGSMDLSMLASGSRDASMFTMDSLTSAGLSSSLDGLGY